MGMRRRRSFRYLLVVVLIACVSLPGTTVEAAETVNRRRPPKVALRYRGEVVQRATPYTYCWSYSSGRYGTAMCADGFPRYPEAAEVQNFARLVVRIPYPVKPTRWFLHAYRAVSSGTYPTPVGDAEKIPFRLKPHRVRGNVTAWDMVFRVEEPLRDYYLDTGGVLHQGDAYYALHVRTTL
jgi:hypothetical protein